jgi:hypothetical protein
MKDVADPLVWFVNEDLLTLGLIAPAEAPPVAPHRAERLAQREIEEYARGSDLAKWYASQRGAVTGPEREALYDEACRQLFRSLLDGGFASDATPLLVNEAGESPMSPTEAERFRGIFWSGDHDRDGRRILSVGLLRELMLDVRLPVQSIPELCRRMNIGLPHWLNSREAAQSHLGGSTSPPTDGAPDPDKACTHNGPTKRSRGRKPKYNWGPIRTLLRAKLQQDGYPDPGDGGQATLERLVADQFPPDACPSETRIRDEVVREISHYRQEVGAEANK